MSGYLTHIIVYLSFVVFLLAVSYSYGMLEYDVKTIIVGCLVGLFYSILPDVDTPSSKMRKLIERIFLAAIVLSLVAFLMIKDVDLVYSAIVLSLILYFLWYVRHRTILHTPIAGVLFSAPLYFIEPVYCLFALIGFVSHLLVDNEVFG